MTNKLVTEEGIEISLDRATDGGLNVHLDFEANVSVPSLRFFFNDTLAYVLEGAAVGALTNGS